MRILWLCNIVLPDFSGEFGIRKANVGGWMTGMLHLLESRKELEIAVCCPIIDAWRLKDGVCNGHKYYAFQFSAREYHDAVKDRFKAVIQDFMPDVVHIWGTEYPHTLAMVNACEELGLLDRVAVNIQGLVSVYAQHYYADVPEEYHVLAVEGYCSLKADHEDFVYRGRYEIQALKKVKHVIGRTDWDEACTKRINPNVQYHFCNEILRDEFYRHIGEWKYEDCKKHTIFVSQASYPIKGLHYLLKAMPDVLRSYPDAHIYVGGNDVTKPDQNGNVPPYGLYIKALMDKFAVSEHVTFLGQLNELEMIEQYKRANVFVSASSIENSSNSVQEAVIVGCPVVASFVGGTEKFVFAGKNGYLYQHDAAYMLGFYINKVFAQQNFTAGYSATQMPVNGAENVEVLCKIYNTI